MKGTPAIYLVKQVRGSTFNSPPGLPCRSPRLQRHLLSVSEHPGCTQGSTEGTVSGETVEAPGQPSRPSHRQHVDPQALRANHTPRLRQQGLCSPPFPESGSGLSKEHNPLKERGCAGPWKARSPGSAGTILQMIREGVPSHQLLTPLSP